ncbi:RNA-directed DNA polymerase, eukaryota, reverse transcriptase zinc-binding domain protein [Tanacetum coccineum]
MVVPIRNGEMLFKKKLSDDESNFMIKEVNDREIKDVMFSIGDNKAPGPDGFFAKFFKKAWHIAGKDVCRVVKEFFSNGQLLGELNATIISLVLKIESPFKVSEFRPIACCDVVYKCISKIITGRNKGCLDKLINLNQSAFIPGRQIQDNILLAQELVKGYGRSGGPKRITCKIDIQKAYDTFSINVNGESYGYFKGGRGLRQGDPMSPYLFTLVMEVFTLIMEKNVANSPGFNYHFGCKELKITHICFADDLLVFCHGDIGSAKVIKKSLEEFGNCSGLLPNFSKSTIFFESMVQASKQDILEVLPFSNGHFPMKYLGKLLLIGSVLEAIHMYWCNVFLLPKNMVKKINKILKNFLWNNEEVSIGSAKVAWKKICKPKIYEGLGLKDITVWNKALLVKHLWNIAIKKDSLWVKWISTMKLKNMSIWVVQKESSDSWGWKNLLDVRDIVVPHVNYEIGDGKKTYMWFDNWSGLGPLINYVSNRSLYDERIERTCHVADLVGCNSWNWPTEWYVTYPFIQNITIPLINTNKEDKVSWISQSEEKQKFSMSIVYHDLKNDNGKWYRVAILYCWPILHVINWPWEELINYFEPLRVYEERNSECVKDEPTWSSLYTVRRLGWVYWKSPSYSVIGCYIPLDDAYSVTCLSIVDVGRMD